MTFISFETFSEIFEALYYEKIKQDDFFESLPPNINTAFTDNDFVVSLMNERNILLKHLFSDEMNYDIDYFLYEWKDGYNIIQDDKEYVVHDLNDMLSYFKEIYY